jgi:hypothetical protein
MNRSTAVDQATATIKVAMASLKQRGVSLTPDDLVTLTSAILDDVDMDGDDILDTETALQGEIGQWASLHMGWTT